MSAKNLRIAIAQICAQYFKKDENQLKVLSIVENALRQKVQLILFPEGVNIGYFVMAQDTDPQRIFQMAYEMADTSTSEWIKELKQLASRGIYIGCGVFLRKSRGRLGNALLFFTPGGKTHIYYKTHLFHMKDVREESFVSKGDKLRVLRLRSFNVGLSICYDLNFPEVFRTLALKGAHIILISAAWPKIAGNVWDILLPARAVENQVFILASNQTGNEYYGNSKIVDYTGNIIARMAEEEGMVIGEIDFEKQKKWRKIVTYFQDRRPEIYSYF